MSEAVFPAVAVRVPAVPSGRALRRFLQDPVSAGSLLLIAVIIAAAALAPWIAPYPYDAVAPADQ